jgi:signal transduction histidine kinase
VQALPPNAHESLGPPLGWLGFALTVAVVVAIGSVVPVTSDYFQLDWRAGLFFIPTTAWGISISLLTTSGVISPRAWAIASIPGGTLTLLGDIGLFALSDGPGMGFLVFLFVLTACAQAYLFRSAPDRPFVTLGAIVAVAFGFTFFDLRAEQFSALVLAGVSSGFLTLAFGDVAAKNDRKRDEAEELRAALQASVLDERAEQLDELSQLVIQLLEGNHDLESSLMAAMVSTEMLTNKISAGTLDSLPPEKLEEICRRISDALGHVKAILDASAEVPFARRTLLESARLAEVVDEVISGARVRFPGVEVMVEGVEPWTVSMAGGRVSLYRALSNLVVNACEGDGARGATRVKITALSSGQGGVELAVEDNGPGFSEDQLERGVEIFESTKVRGRGLGLHTVARLVNATGGGMTRGRSPLGGAFVALTLPAENGPWSQVSEG